VVAEDVEGKVGIMASAIQWRAATGSLPQMVGQGDRIRKREACAITLQFDAFLTARRAFMMFLFVESATRRCRRRFERGQEFGHVER